MVLEAVRLLDCSHNDQSVSLNSLLGSSLPPSATSPSRAFFPARSTRSSCDLRPVRLTPSLAKTHAATISMGYVFGVNIVKTGRRDSLGPRSGLGDGQPAQ